MKISKKLFALLLCMTILFTCGMSIVSGAENPTVSTLNITVDGNGYIVLSGSADANETYGAIVKDANGLIIYVSEVTADSSGAFTASFLPEENLPQGSVTAQVGNKTATLANYVDPTLRSGKDILSFTANNEEGTISGSYIFVTLPKGSDLTDIIPVFTLSPGAKAYVNGVEQLSGLTSVNFTESVTYTVRAENRDEKKYTVVITIRTEVDDDDDDSGNSSSGPGGSIAGPSKPTAAPTSAPSGRMFVDIDDVPWAITSIEALAKVGVVNGIGNNMFDPHGLVTREQFAKMLVEACGFDVSGATCDFYDVVTGSWYYRYVAEANRQGIMKGISEEYMGIGQNITRQDLCTMVYRAMQVKGITLPQKETAETFRDDAEISDYARDAVTALQQAGIIDGMGDGSFAPQATATRAQAAKIIYGVYMLMH